MCVREKDRFINECKITHIYVHTHTHIHTRTCREVHREKMRKLKAAEKEIEAKKAAKDARWV
jgi:hypothetical protein